MTKTLGYGSVLVVTTTTGDANIAQIRNFGGPSASFGDVDTTTLDSSSNYRTFVPGLGDPGEVTLALVYDPTAITHKRLTYYMGQRSVKGFKVYHGSTAGTEQTFNAYVKSLGRETPLDNLITADVTLKVTGKPGYTT